MINYVYGRVEGLGGGTAATAADVRLFAASGVCVCVCVWFVCVYGLCVFVLLFVLHCIIPATQTQSIIQAVRTPLDNSGHHSVECRGPLCGCCVV